MTSGYSFVAEGERKRRVLVVDDEPRILRLVRIRLDLAGYEVMTTTDGQQALDLVQAKKPDIMLLDIVMLPMSGFEVLSRLRAFCQIPVIVFTGLDAVADRAYKAGANAFIVKPFDPEELVKTIKELAN